MDIFAIIISGMSLLLSLITLYLNFFKPPKVRICFGDSGKIYYADYDGAQHGSGLYLPVDFINATNKTVVIIQTAVVLFNKNNSNERFFMMQRQFSKLDVDKKIWSFDELAHSIVIPPKNSVNKIIWYYWFINSIPSLKFEKGEYELHFYYWLKSNKKPKCVKSSFSISDKMFGTLEEFKSTTISSTIDIVLDKNFDINKSLTLNEEKKIFG